MRSVRTVCYYYYSSLCLVDLNRVNLEKGEERSKKVIIPSYFIMSLMWVSAPPPPPTPVKSDVWPTVLSREVSGVIKHLIQVGTIRFFSSSSSSSLLVHLLLLPFFFSLGINKSVSFYVVPCVNCLMVIGIVHFPIKSSQHTLIIPHMATKGSIIKSVNF